MEGKTNTKLHGSNGVHIAVFPYFAFGHINPFIHISNKLASHGVRISFLSAPGNIPRIRSALASSVSIVPLTFPHVDGLPSGFESTSEISPAIAELLKVALDRMQPQIRSILSELSPEAVFFDFAQNWLPSMASELGIKTVMFSVFSLISNSYLMGVSSRVSADELPSIEELKRPPPGYPNPNLSLKTFQAKDLLYPYTRFNGGSSALQRNYAGIQGCDALAYKSCHEMEGPYWEFFQKAIGKPILMAGIPLPETNPNDDPLDHDWAAWLAQFPPKTVVFCSFGSETFLSSEQVKELALGLELTGLPFLMVPSSNGLDQEKLDQALPEGFADRVKERGRIHIGWVPQHKIMAHQSVGCYINHAGFGSVMEAIVSDCQLVLVPFKGDQFLNSKLLSLDMKVGIEVERRDEDGYFGKEDIFEAVKTVTIDACKEPGNSIVANLAKWKELLMNREFENKYVLELVNQVKTLVAKKDA